MQKSVIIMLMLGAVLLSSVTMAKPDREGRGGNPPPEAIEACEGKEQGDEVSFTTRRGDTIRASCETMQNGLVAVPEGHEQRKSEKN